MRFMRQTMVFVLTFMTTGFVDAAEVNRAVFTLGIENREPIDDIQSIDSNEHISVTFFTELGDFNGQTATHQWVFNEKVMFEKTFEIKGERWRIWTSKTLIPSWVGTWTVRVLDDDRSVVASSSFDYL